MKKLSIIIPAYNEANRIPDTLRDIDDTLLKLEEKFDYEILVVNDGSKDGTVEVLKKLQKQIPKLTILDNKENRGKGWVTRQGMLRADGDLRLFMDADNSTKFSEIFKILPYFENGFDVVIGSRYIEGSKINLKQPRLRIFLGRMMRVIVHILIPLGIVDSQCGFKVLSAKAVQTIFPQMTILGWAFDVEMLTLAKKNKLKIKEVPVVWNNHSESHIKFSGMVQILWEIIKTRIKYPPKHWPALVLGLFFALIMILPTISAIQKIGRGNFQQIYPLLNDDDDHYLAMVKEVYDGHWNLSNPYIKEYKNSPYTQPPLGAVYYATFAKVFDISVPAAATVNDFILTFISFLLLYGLFFRLTDSSKIALVSSFLFFMFFVSALNRTVNPQLSIIFLIAGLHLMLLISGNKYAPKIFFLYNFLLAVIFGILVYIYPFYWMVIVVVYGLLTLFRALTENDFKYCFKNWVSFFIPASIFLLPFAYNALCLMQSPFFTETNARNGFISTHFPGAFTNVALVILCIPIVYLVHKLYSGDNGWQSTKNIFLCWSLVIGGVILNWQNIITGKTLQFPPHFFPVMILFVFIIGAIATSYLNMKKLSKHGIVLLAFLFIFGAGIFYKQKNEIINAFKIIYDPPDISQLQRLSSVMDWLNQNTLPDSAVFTLGKGLDSSLPIYTDNNVYYTTNANIFLMSDDELENRWVIQHFFDDVQQKDVYGNRDIWPNRFIDTYQNNESRRKILQFVTGKKYPETVLMDEAVVNEVLAKYAKFKTMGFEKALKTYDVDYVIVDFSDEKYKNLENIFKQFSFLVPRVKSGNTYVFEVK